MFSIEFFPDKNFLMVTISGTITLEDSTKIMRAVVEHEEFSEQYNRLYNFEKAILDWGGDDIQALIDFIRGRFENSNDDLKVVFVNSDSTEQTLLSLYLSIAPQKLNRNFNLFKTLPEAIEWICKEE
ncbi:STAS/SEC14 domain-containing protein [Pleionea sediminis]|uniref:STAS/SEC14 domain-containing protein n=1 Tax=Pleionea sediminis TaxID=2569479 RepID=UPI001185B6B3|nr:STAS/SEC14 domain-containing protein [Pleionea sediminis]